jgi:hypothetical protein
MAIEVAAGANAARLTLFALVTPALFLGGQKYLSKSKVNIKVYMQ